MKVRKDNTSPKATRIFTDREEPREAFWKQYNNAKAELQQDESNIRVLNFYGIGGIGKSSLLKKLMSEMDEQISSSRYVYIDLNINQESKVVLERMKNKLADSCKFSFPLFELGCYAYAKKVGDNADPVEVKQLTEKSPVLSMMLSVAGEIPVVGIAAKALSLADQGVAYIRSHLKNHNRELKQIEFLEPEDLYKLLPGLFAKDLAHNLEKKATEPLVILLDTYEKLVNELSTVGEPLKNDEWIRGENGLVQNIPNTLWVIAGREKLKWEIFDHEWADAIESHILGSLSFADSDSFLMNAGIDDSQLRKQLYDLTKGTPVYLDLCVDRFLRISENGEEADISMFGKNTFDLIERFVRYMSETQKDLVYMLACLNKWDDGLIADIAPSVLPNFSFTSYEKAKDYSFVIASGDGYCNLHQTVGSVLMSNCPDSIRQRVGNALVERFSKTVEKKNLFSSEFSTALTYLLQAGLLLHKDRDELREYYKGKISKNLVDLAESGQFEQAKAIFELISDFTKQNKTDLLYASVILDEASFVREAGDYSLAKKHVETALKIYLTKKGEDHPDTLTAMNDLACTYGDLGEYQKAWEIEQTLLEKRKAILGENHPDTLSSMNDLAYTLNHLGKCQKALELNQFVFEKRRTILGDDHPDTLIAINNFASTLSSLGKYQKAWEIEQTLLEKRKAILGEDHPDTLTAMNNLASTLSNLGKHQKALELYQTVLEKFRAILGEDHPFTLSAMNNFASTLNDLGEHQKALGLYQTVLEKRRAILGEDHPDTLSAMNNLASTLSDLGEHQKALDLFQNVLEKFKATFGEDHPHTLTAMNNLAYTLSDLGEHQKALELYQIVLEKRKAILGDNHPDTLTAMNNLASTLSDLNEHQKALELYQTMLEKLKATFGEDHPDTLLAMNNLAYTLSNLGEHQKALELFQIVLKKRKAILGEDHPDTLEAMSNLASTLGDLGEHQKALELYQTVLEKRRAILGEDHPDTLSTMVILSYTLYELEMYEKALELNQIVLEKCKAVFGESHPDTIYAMKMLIITLVKLGEMEKAAALYKKIKELTEN